MAYTHTTFAALKSQLAARLHDTSNVHFLDAELGVYIAEALRTFSAFSLFWRTQQSFNTVASTEFYDLPTQLPTELGYTVSDRDLINAIEYHFQEPATSAWAAGWTGTAMFVMSDLTNALQRRRDQFLVDTGVVITRSTPAPAPSGGRVTMVDSIIDIRRLVWVPSAHNLLWRVDEYQLSALSSTWATAAAQTPLYFSIMSPPPLTVQLAPAPSATQTLDILSVSSGAAFTPTASETVLGVPDDMSWIVKWGAMADLLSKDGPAQDPERAEYCEKRYQQGILLARMMPVLFSAKIGTSALLMNTIYDMDAYNLTWQDDTEATPVDLLQAGRNLIALHPTPDGVYSVTLDVVQNAPIPSAAGDYVQVGREQLEPILGYAEHLAMFKEAGPEWQATMSGFENLIRSAALYNNRLGAAAQYIENLKGSPTREEEKRKRLKTMEAPE